MKTIQMLLVVTLGWLTLPVSGWAYYNPEAGRWLSRDPIGEQGGRNLYAFARNVSTMRIDTDGRVDIGVEPICPCCGTRPDPTTGKCRCEEGPQPPGDGFDYPWWVDAIDIACDVGSAISIGFDIATIPSGEGALATAGLQTCKYKCKTHVKDRLECIALYKAMKLACDKPHSCNLNGQSSGYYAARLSIAIACEGAREAYQKKCWKPKSDPRWEGHMQRIAEEARTIKKCSEQLVEALVRESKQ